MWERLKQLFPWLAAGILFLIVLVQNVLKEWITNLIKAVGDRVYNRLAGSRLFLRASLRRYQQSLIAKYEKPRLSFWPGRPSMHRVFVPLKIDISADIYSDRRLVIKGSPGSGKSMLLRYVALNYAEGQFNEWSDRPVPVLLELRRLNDPKLAIEDQLVEELARNDFPGARRFVSRTLEQGRLWLLLDGLDEVSSNERKRVVQQISDFLDKHKQCRAIITCRTAVYRGELDAIVDKTPEIVDFDDQRIERFLRSWEMYMEGQGKSVLQLIRTLQDRPHIMSLARNPLLLTIIAHLYTQTEFTLPRSRVEFYHRATDHLLSELHEEHNRFLLTEKRLVLQHLALFNQDNVHKRGQDRHAIDRLVTLEQIRQVLPNLNLRPEDAVPLLEEIVQRSGLLLSIDGGERYQFAHATMQEYFAATQLSDDPDGLLARFKPDKDTWRETVKLWCGLAHDSTVFIRAVYAEDPIVAFECLADAQQIDQTAAEEIIEAFKARLGTVNHDDAIARAFGAAAADLRPRGTAVFKFLAETLAKSEETGCRATAADALSFTNRPEAAETLADYYATCPEVRIPLARMGNLAVSALVRCIERGLVDAMDDLQTIGTSYAASALVPFLWSKDESTAYSAAWYVAALMNRPGVEDILRDYPLTDDQRQSQWLEWVWEPFDEPTNSSMPVIAGRIMYLMARASHETVPATPQPIDPRLIIPFCCVEAIGDVSLAALNEPAPRLVQLQTAWTKLSALRNEASEIELQQALQEAANQFGLSMNAPESEFQSQIVSEFVATTKPTGRWQYIINGLSPTDQYVVVRRLMPGRAPTRDDWRNVFHPVKYEFATGWHYRVTLALVAILSLIALGQMIVTLLRSPVSPSWGNGLVFVAAVAVVLCWYIMWRDLTGSKRKKPFDPFYLVMLVFGVALIPVVAVYSILVKKEQFESRDTLAIPFVGWLPTVGYFITVLLLNITSWPLVTVFWLALLGVGVALWWFGYRREHLAENPLQGILGTRPHTPTLDLWISKIKNRLLRFSRRVWHAITVGKKVK